MSGPFFYLPPEAWGREVSLEGQEAKHLGQVLRLVPGDEVSLLDGKGRTGRFAVRAVSKKAPTWNACVESFTPRPASLAVMALPSARPCGAVFLGKGRGTGRACRLALAGRPQPGQTAGRARAIPVRGR